MTNDTAMEIDLAESKRSMAEQKKDEGNELFKTKQYREALQRYSEAIDLEPACPAYYGNRSACHLMLSDHVPALADARTSVALDSAFVKGYVRIAKCCLALGDLASAAQAVAKAAEIEPTNAAVDAERRNVEALQRLRDDYQTAYAGKDYRRALFCLDRALQSSSACKQLKSARAECLAFLGRHGEAQQVANDLLRADSTNADAIYVRGLCLYYEDHVDKAFQHFQQVLRLAPDHEKAKEVYKKAKVLKQKKEEGNHNFKIGKYQEAYDLYSEALLIDPLNKTTNAKIYFNRGTVAAKLGKVKESVEDCTSALQLDEHYVKAVVRRANSYMELEQFEEAVRDFELAHKLDKSNMEYRRMLQHAKVELKKSKRKDFYKILGIHKTASEDEIKKAYKKRALAHHPDRHASASESEKKEHEKKFKEIGEAYAVLSDSRKRARYDNGHDLDDMDGHGGHAGFGHGIDPNHIFQTFFANGAGGMGGMGGGPGQGYSFGGGPGSNNFSFQFG